MHAHQDPAPLRLVGSSASPPPQSARPLKRPVRVESLPGPTDAVDLRRDRCHRQVDRILARCVWLDPADRVLLESVFRDHKPVAAIARMMGVDPRTLRLRVRRLVRRVLSPQYMRVVASIDRRAPLPPRSPSAPRIRRSAWSHQRQRVAEECLINGRSIREAARALHLSLHTVRSHRDAAQAVVDSESDGRVR